MKLSDRDFKLIIILAIAVIIALPILIFIRPLNNQIAKTEGDITERSARRDFLDSLRQNVDYYDKSITDLDEARMELISNYAMGVRRENTIIFLANTECELNFELRAISFTDTDPITITDPHYDDKEGKYIPGLTASSCISTISYCGTYKSMEAFLDFIKKNKERMVITSFSAKQNELTGNVEGVLLLQQYAVSGWDGERNRVLEKAKIPEFKTGNKNVFGIPIVPGEGIEEVILDNEEEGEEEEE